MNRLLIVLLLLLGACASQDTGLRPMSEPQAGAYRLGPGDRVRVVVFGLDAATGSYAVSDGGVIALPLVGTIPANGRTVDQMQADIVAAAVQRQLLRQPSVSVQVETYRPFFILGEVAKPGQYPFVPGMTVTTAVSIAGGYTFRAAKDRAVVTRPTGTGIEKGSARPETRLMPGDTITIPEDWF